MKVLPVISVVPMVAFLPGATTRAPDTCLVKSIEPRDVAAEEDKPTGRAKPEQKKILIWRVFCKQKIKRNGEKKLLQKSNNLATKLVAWAIQREAKRAKNRSVHVKVRNLVYTNTVCYMGQTKS